jgi:hypothetical protein
MIERLCLLALLIPMTAHAQVYPAPNIYAFEYGYPQAPIDKGKPKREFHDVLLAAETEINKERRQRGEPPCAIGLPRQIRLHREPCKQ